MRAWMYIMTARSAPQNTDQGERNREREKQSEIEGKEGRKGKNRGERAGRRGARSAECGVQGRLECTPPPLTLASRKREGRETIARFRRQRRRPEGGRVAAAAHAPPPLAHPQRSTPAAQRSRRQRPSMRVAGCYSMLSAVCC